VCLCSGAEASQEEGASWPHCSTMPGEQPLEKELPLLGLPRRRTGGGEKKHSLSMD